MRNLLFCALLFLYTTSLGQSRDTSENWQVEMATNLSYYNSLSISVEKSFNYGKWVLGPRLELVNLFSYQSYIGEDDSTYSMRSQIRVRLAQIEYRINPKLRVGIAPFWMLGPLPKRGFYKSPSSIYAHVQIKEGLSLETSFTTSSREMIQLSFRKAI